MTIDFFKGTPGKKFVPSNSGEFMDFSSIFCEQCQKDINEDCDILLAAMMSNVDDPEYPSEWIYGKDEQPRCTAFERAEN